MLRKRTTGDILGVKFAWVGLNLIAFGIPTYFTAMGLQQLHIVFSDSIFISDELHAVERVGHGASAIGAGLLAAGIVLRTPSQVNKRRC